MRPNPQQIADLVTFIEEILNGKLYFLCSEISDALPQIHAITVCDNITCKFNVEKIHVFKKGCNDLSTFTLIKMLGSHITMNEDCPKGKVIFHYYV